MIEEGTDVLLQSHKKRRKFAAKQLVDRRTIEKARHFEAVLFLELLEITVRVFPDLAVTVRLVAEQNESTLKDLNFPLAPGHQLLIV